MTALKSESLSQNDIEYINMDIPVALSSLLNGSIDAALLAGPAALQALESGQKLLLQVKD